jgi:hypothetical protein
VTTVTAKVHAVLGQHPLFFDALDSTRFSGQWVGRRPMQNSKIIRSKNVVAVVFRTH